ncbi:FHA domain-containing protein [Oceanirhabdus sp. W0125-5]|uniref:FHA domain-containing protein n=1 Tax=Oceanirhabdus sp. W0125-5 TaxID=2999116 RepID=UPI0022F31E37|nr:FHA domain-containing protein [Oceanirhabdus sp. W0125-5]WBW99288.1 FHA domain-containing protein [Oceanirhabdus sp. W0125-5]
MLLSKLSLIFKLLIIVFIYGIIYYALKVMYKDINKNEKKTSQQVKTIGLEVLDPGNNTNLKHGSLIPVVQKLSIGRDKKNMVQLEEKFVSGKHAVIKLVGDGYYIEDLNSTNGTILNNEKITEKVWLSSGDLIKVGTSVFRVIV